MAPAMALSLLALFVPLVFANIRQHTLRVSENGSLFNQATNVDVENQIVYIHVPAHGDVPESRVMYEFTSGRVLRCTPSIQRCYLSNFDTRSTPGARQEENALKEFARKQTTPPEEEESESATWQDMVVTERIQNTEFLTERMRQVLGTHALYREEPLPSGSETMTGQLDLNSNRNQEKRTIVNCRYDRAPVIKYAFTTRGCNRLVWCPDPNRQTSCSLVHRGARDFLRCMCCPEVTDPRSCVRCFSMP